MTKRTFITVLIALMTLAFAACTVSGAEAAVKDGLDQLKASETAPASLASVQEDLPEEAAEDFGTFLGKLRDFDYKVIGSEKVSENGEDYTIVNVRITSYDFGREYIATWKDYLRTHKNASAEDAAGNEFLTELFSRLAALDKKDHISFVEIKATETDEGWTTDIQTNEKLQDALFGGMIGEMKTLAGE